MDLSSKSLKKLALDKLHGNWLSAIAVTFVAGIITGGGAANGGGTAADNASEQANTLGGAYDNFVVDVINQVPPGVLIALSSFLFLAVIWAIVSFLISGAIDLGLSLYFIKLCRGETVSFGILFSRMRQFLKGLGLNIIMGIFIFLWCLLLIVPGIIAAYRYSMAHYIMADNPDIGIMEAISRSKQMMAGNKWNLFKLHLSFIGWSILCVFTLGLGFIVLTPYTSAAEAGFYLRLNGGEVLGEGIPEVALQQ